MLLLSLYVEQITEEVQIEHSKEALNENITETFINEQKEDNSSKFNRVVEDVRYSQDSQNSNNGNISWIRQCLAISFETRI